MVTLTKDSLSHFVCIRDRMWCGRLRFGTLRGEDLGRRTFDAWTLGRQTDVPVWVPLLDVSTDPGVGSDRPRGQRATRRRTGPMVVPGLRRTDVGLRTHTGRRRPNEGPPVLQSDDGDVSERTPPTGRVGPPLLEVSISTRGVPGGRVVGPTTQSPSTCPSPRLRVRHRSRAETGKKGVRGDLTRMGRLTGSGASLHRI